MNDAVRIEAVEAAATATRDWSIDALRGAIIALMALDHVRIFLSSAQFDPINLEQTTPALFLTRWVTHLCAPGFFFLAGLSVALFQRDAGRSSTARFLLVRGFFLMVTEVVVFGLAWSFNPGWWWFGVIWGLGAAMVALAALIHFPKMALFAAVGFTVLHNSLWPAAGGSTTIGALLYSGGLASIPLLGEHLVIYPLLPWLALMVIGYGAALWIAPQADPRGWRAIGIGSASLAAFVPLRMAGLGEPAGGGLDQSGSLGRSMLSLLNVEKYPPSLQYSLLTLGLCLILLGLFRQWPATKKLGQPLAIFGRVPFFFYAIHLFAIHGLALGLAMALGWRTDYLFWDGVGPKLIPPDGFGLSLAGIYATWLLILAALLPACDAFGHLKRRRSSPWLKLL